ncbi:uncharacterized protein TNCV_4335021 [Trichonephila clavipes]|uniref:Uncharacterized protein n=1 Tax=Trichonephila clavipes TaxID=2585209 RepID=A0A8X6V0Q0_TRICX|nr:uncharacterized protein TNCV_4335021 [Trichonephila clavipes]
MIENWVASIESLRSTGLQHQDGRIRGWRNPGKRTIAVCICHRHTGLSPGVMLWDAIGSTSWSSLVRIEGPLNSARYIFGVLRPMALPFIRALRNSMFQQNNARSPGLYGA